MLNKDGCDESQSCMQLQCDGDGFLIWLTRQGNGLTQNLVSSSQEADENSVDAASEGGALRQWQIK